MRVSIIDPPKTAILSQADWTTLQSAHEQASRFLERSAQKHEHANRLAREVFRLFNQGHRDPNIIAVLAAQLEVALARKSKTWIQLKVLPFAHSQVHIGPVT